MTPKDSAAMLVATLLTTICSTAGAPVLPGDGSNLLDRSIRGFQQMSEHHPAWDSATVHQPAYGHYGGQLSAHADRSAQYWAPSDAHAAQHYYPDMYPWAQNPPDSYPNQLYDPTLSPSGSESPYHLSQPDLDEVITLLHDSQQEWQLPPHPTSPDPLRFTSTEAAQQHPVGNFAGFHPSTFQGQVGNNHLAGMHPAMGAPELVLPSSTPLTQHDRAGSPSLPGETLVGQPLYRIGSRTPKTAVSTQETKRLRKNAQVQARRQRIKLEKDREAAAMRERSSANAQHSLSDDEKRLLRLGNALFTEENAASQPVIDTIPNPREGFVLASGEQTLIVQEVLERRFGMFKLKGDRTGGFQLTRGPIPLRMNKPVADDLFSGFDEARLAALRPFQTPGPNWVRHKRRAYLDDFVLGDYVIRIHHAGTTGHAVWAYPITSLRKGKSEWEKGDPKTIFVGWLETQGNFWESRSNAAKADAR